MKRSLLLRCLVVLLSLALASGNAHAALHLGAAHSEPCPEEHADHHGKTSPHQHRRDKDLACCCDCLGCSSAAYIAPDSGITAAELAAQIHYDALASLLSGRTLRPEPDPPKPGKGTTPSHSAPASALILHGLHDTVSSNGGREESGTGLL